jgi:site-specific DNA-cytosine methylase
MMMAKQMKVYRAWTPFGGCGGGGLGVLAARAEVRGVEGRFELIGGLDIDRIACDTFEYLTGVKQLCKDIREVTPEKLRADLGPNPPDLIYGSPPCQGSSQLITNEKAVEEKYELLNELTLVLVNLIFETWPEGPPILVFENVPNIRNRAKRMLVETRRFLHSKRYLIHDEAHELGKFGHMYDAGETGGLAQSRKRWLMVARCPRRVSAPIHLPPPLRHLTVGEVIESLPLPNDSVGGPMHTMPAINILNWIRLALIPAGGDHRDLPAVLERLGERYKTTRMGLVPQANNPNAHAHKFRVNKWDGHASTVTTAVQIGSGAQSVADPLIRNTGNFSGPYGVVGWDDKSPTVASAGTVRNRPTSVADPLVRKSQPFNGPFGVVPWDRHSPTIASGGHVSSRPMAVQDRRVMAGEVGWFGGVLGVVPWSSEAGTITHRSTPTNGAFSVADPRVPRAYDRGYGVLGWNETSPTVAAGSTGVGQGAYAVADHRVEPTLPFEAIGPIPLDEILVMLHEPGPWAIVDKSKDGAPILIIDDVSKKSPVPLIIIAEDRTWHRPFTPLELARIQGFPAEVRGEPLHFAGSGSTDWREQIGNAIPPPAACAMAQMFLRSFLQSELDAYEFGADGGFWVKRRTEEFEEALAFYNPYPLPHEPNPDHPFLSHAAFLH